MRNPSFCSVVGAQTGSRRLLGRDRVCAAVQAADRETLPMAAKRTGTEETNKAGVPLTHGGAIHRAEEGVRAGKTGHSVLRGVC